MTSFTLKIKSVDLTSYFLKHEVLFLASFFIVLRGISGFLLNQLQVGILNS